MSEAKRRNRPYRAKSSGMSDPLRALEWPS
jgi:hypothetical protein